MKWWIAVVVLGVFLLVSSIGIGRGDGTPGEIKCGSDVMRPGDVCEETKRGVVTDTYTYEQKYQDEKDGAAAWFKSGRWVQLGLGSALLVGGAVGIVLTRRRRAQQKAKYTAMYTQQPQIAGHAGQPAQQSWGPPAPTAQAPHIQPHMAPSVQQRPPQHQYPPQQYAPQQYPPQQYPPQQYPPPQQQQQYPDFGPRPGQ